MGALKKIGVTAFTVAIMISLIFLSLASIKKNANILSMKEISKSSNISSDLSYHERSAVSKSRLSAVRIISMSPDGSALSSMSGTYFSFLGRYYVLTVMHGIAGPCDVTKIMVGEYYYNCLQYVTSDRFYDYMVMEVEKIEERAPANLFGDIYPVFHSRSSPAILENVYYTGYPNMMGPFTIRGHLMGYDASDERNFYILSYAWMGASGSGVFNDNGNLIGYVLALDVGRTEYGVQILENVVMVGATSNIDWEPLFKDVY